MDVGISNGPPGNNDVITIDPPPASLAAAGLQACCTPKNSMESCEAALYARGAFFSSGRMERIQSSLPDRPGPQGLISLCARLPSVEGWGCHFLASTTPIPGRTTHQLVDRMPTHAISDMMEWGPGTTPERQFGLVLDHELSLDKVIAQAPNVTCIGRRSTRQ